MPNYEKLYYQLFAAVSDVAEDGKLLDAFAIRQALVQVLLEAEDRYLDETEPEAE